MSQSDIQINLINENIDKYFDGKSLILGGTDWCIDEKNLLRLLHEVIEHMDQTNFQETLK